ncbi:MAG: tyrosine-type recombinase/integrase [Thermoleophilia bacterium]|nr:tyrosine-type recombinase/integrase [Thermoleophilia bacterium]
MVVGDVWRLRTGLPPEPASGEDGLPFLGAKGGATMRCPKRMGWIEATGKKSAEHLDEDETLVTYPPKNGKARVVPLPAAACDELRTALQAQREYKLAQGRSWNEAGHVIPKKDGTPMAPSSLKSQWWNWVARQRIDPHLPLHGLRDSFGTWVYETYGVKQAQEWLGHGDPATTLRHYVRLTTAARAKAVAGLDDVTRAALERAEEKALEDAKPALDNVVSLTSRRQA